MKIAVDFDGVLTCVNRKEVAQVKRLIAAGHKVFVFTGRPEKLRRETQKLLDGAGLGQLGLVMDKPHYDAIVDDKAFTSVQQLARAVNGS